MRMKTIMTAACAAVLLLGFASVALAGPIVLKFSHVVAENTPKGKMATKFRDLVAERLAGKVEVQVFPSSQLFDDDKVMEAMLLGDVHLAAPALSKFETYTKVFQVFDLPFLFKDMAAVDCFQQGPVGQKFLKAMESKGVLGLGYLHNGMKQISSSSPLRVPADASGKKFRIMTSDVLAAQFEALKATPLKKPFSEVFILLQTKAIDGQENTYSNIFSQKFHEVQPFITESNHGLLDYLLVTSAEFWNGLPKDIRAELEKCLKDATDFGNKLSEEINMADRQKIIDSKQSEIIVLKPEERAQWVEAMKPVWAKFEPGIGKEAIDAALACNK